MLRIRDAARLGIGNAHGVERRSLVIPVALLLLLVLLDRLMVSDRWPRLDPTRRVWRLWTPRVLAQVRSAPGTYAYLFVLLITTWVLQTSSSTIANQLLLERSTNLSHLGRDPVRVLFSSAFWVSSSLDLLGWVVLFSFFVAQAERWLGTARTAAVFFLGHVGATLLTALGLWAALHSDLVEASVVNAEDVGASYGFAAVAAVLTYGLARPWRWRYAAVVVAFVGITFAFDHSFTNWGHLIALAIGFACYPLVRRRRATAFAPGMLGLWRQSLHPPDAGASSPGSRENITESRRRPSG
ncbi:MAG: rhomboid-like protein [Gaiellaceae bacterium]